MSTTRFKPFRPHPLLRSGHAQTLAAVYAPGRLPRYNAQQRLVTLDDGDQIVLHDDRPHAWRIGDRTALLIHGLAGCHLSPYMQRMAAKLGQRGVRAFRMDLRGCGAGVHLARHPYHSGRWQDAAAALEAIAAWCPDSPTALLGFSLGGSIVLNLVGRCGDRPPGNLDRAAAINPPIDLLASVRWIARPQSRLYDRHFARLLMAQLGQRLRVVPDAQAVPLRRRPRGIWQFDDAFTAPVCGFGTAENYYRQCSSAPLVPEIRLPTLILTARDDPLIPVATFERIASHRHAAVHIAAAGGHVGFIGAKSADADRRWLDWRLVEWVTAADPDECACHFRSGQ